MSAQHAAVTPAAGIGSSPGWTYRASRHQAPLPTVRSLLGELPPGGVVLGTDADGRLVPIRLFRSRPMRIAVVGSPAAAAVLALRSVAVGASVHVSTSVLRQWEPLEQACLGAMTVAVAGRQREAPVRPTAARPRLLIVDASVAPRQLAGATGAHSAAVTLVRAASPVSAPVLRTADLVVVPGGAGARRPGPAAALATLGVPEAAVDALGEAADDTVLVIAERGPMQVKLGLTGTEQHYLGLAGHLFG